VKTRVDAFDMWMMSVAMEVHLRGYAAERDQLKTRQASMLDCHWTTNLTH